MKKRMAHRMMPDANGGSSPERTSGRRLKISAARRRPAVDGPNDVRDVEAGPDVELRGEAHLHVAHALLLAVLGQLEGRALQGLLVLQGRHGVLEALQVLVEVRVPGPEYQRFEPFGRLRGQGNLAVAGQLDERPEAQRSVEVDVEVGLGEAADQVLVHARIMPPGGLNLLNPRAPSRVTQGDRVSSRALVQ